MPGVPVDVLKLHAKPSDVALHDVGLGDEVGARVADTREYFRANAEAELPAPGEDALFDMVQTLTSACESSPEGSRGAATTSSETTDQQEGAAD